MAEAGPSLAPRPQPAAATPPAEPPAARVVANRATSRPGRISHAEADAILARIVAGLSIPAAELGVGERVKPGTKATAAGKALADRSTDATDDTPSLSRAERRAAAQTLQAGGKLSEDEAAALLAGADVAPATWAVSRAERRGLAAAVEAGRPLSRSQQRVIAGSVATDAPARGGKRAAVAARDDTPAAPTARQRRALAAKVAAGTPLGDDERAALGLDGVTAARTAPTRAERRALAAAIGSGATLSHTQQRQLAALAEPDAAPEPKGKRGGGKDADDKRAAKAEPSRIWVQVAGGANEGDLTKAWAATKSKAPGAFAGRQAWTTPLRATNRVLTGPFKTDAEARAYVNQLAKSGVSAFSFTSDAGQKVTRLDTQ